MLLCWLATGLRSGSGGGPWDGLRAWIDEPTNGNACCVISIQSDRVEVLSNSNVFHRALIKVEHGGNQADD